MPRTEYNDSEAEKLFKDNEKVPLPRERPSSASAEWNNSPEGKMDAEYRALKKPNSSLLRKSTYGN